MKDYPDKMTPEQARTFRDAVLNIVSQIPRPLLESEDITFKPNGHVDMQRHLWEPETF